MQNAIQSVWVRLGQGFREFRQFCAFGVAILIQRKLEPGGNGLARGNCFLFALGIALAVGISSVLGGTSVSQASPTLTPNEQQFVNDLATIGITPTSGLRGLVGLGYYFCSELSNGKTLEYMQNRAYAEITGSTPGQANAALDSAIKNLCPAAPPVSAGRDQASAEQAVKDAYTRKVANCFASRNEVPDVRSISWDAPGYSEQTGGSGYINDANPNLGRTQFMAMWIVGRWDVQINAC